MFALKLHAPDVQTVIEFRAVKRRPASPLPRLRPRRQHTSAAALAPAKPKPAPAAKRWGRPCPTCGKVMRWHFCEPCRAAIDRDIAKMRKIFKNCETGTFI